MNQKPIVFFDSGVGGLPYLALAQRRLPAERFIYVGDRRHYPYGDKTQDEIRENVLESFQLIMERFSPKTAVIACNTASVVALSALRARFSIPFIGVVPAVKPAAGLTKNNRIGVLATPQTVKNDYLDGLIRDFAPGCTVVRIPLPELRDLVEKQFFSALPELKNRIVGNAARAVEEAAVDVVVLACTHFLHVEKELHDALPPGILIIDSRDGVISQLERVLDKKSLRSQTKYAPDLFYVTGEGALEEQYARFAGAFGLEPGGSLA
jgi:glutamate racemase